MSDPVGRLLRVPQKEPSVFIEIFGCVPPPVHMVRLFPSFLYTFCCCAFIRMARHRTVVSGACSDRHIFSPENFVEKKKDKKKLMTTIKQNSHYFSHPISTTISTPFTQMHLTPPLPLLLLPLLQCITPLPSLPPAAFSLTPLPTDTCHVS